MRLPAPSAPAGPPVTRRWQAAAERVALYVLISVATVSWGLTVLSAPYPAVAGVGGILLATITGPWWSPRVLRWLQRPRGRTDKTPP